MITKEELLKMKYSEILNLKSKVLSFKDKLVENFEVFK